MEKLDKKVEQAISETVLGYPKNWTHGICAYTCLDRETGDSTKGQYGRYSMPDGDVCHAELNYLKNDPIVVNANRKQWAKVSPDFILWVAQESPFAHGVRNKDNVDELFNHASVLDIKEIGKGGALWLCKAWRHFEEDTWKPKLWTQLRNEGLTGLQAFIGSEILDQEGNPYCGISHVSLFGYESPTNLRKHYDKILNMKKNETRDAVLYSYEDKGNWGSLTGRKEKKSDGWGGFIEVIRPCSCKDYAEKLREIFEGDPKNVA